MGSFLLRKGFPKSMKMGKGGKIGDLKTVKKCENVAKSWDNLR